MAAGGLDSLARFLGRCGARRLPPLVAGCSICASGCRGVKTEGWGGQAAVVLYVLAMVAVVVGVDVMFLRHQFLERLMVNVGIVVVFGALYWRFREHQL